MFNKIVFPGDGSPWPLGTTPLQKGNAAQRGPWADPSPTSWDLSWEKHVECLGGPVASPELGMLWGVGQVTWKKPPKNTVSWVTLTCLTAGPPKALPFKFFPFALFLRSPWVLGSFSFLFFLITLIGVTLVHRI